MRNVVCVALALTMSVQAGAQQGATASPEQAAWPSGSGLLEFSSCAMSQQGGEAVLSATIVTAGAGGGPHVKRSVGNAGYADRLGSDHASFIFSWSWGQSNGGSAINQGGAGMIVPTVTAHAINTKGAGGVGRVASQACAAPPPGQRLLLPAVQKREAKPVTTCDASGDPAMPTFTIRMPLSAFGPNAKTGHVSLIKREASAPSLSERTTRAESYLSVISCAANAKGGATYDLAVGKKV